MQTGPKTYHVPDDSELADLLTDADSSGLVLERNGRRYRVSPASEDIIYPRETVTTEEWLRRASRVLRGVDTEQLQREIHEARGQDSEGRPA